MRRNAGGKRRKPANQAAFLHIIATSRLLEVLRDDDRAIIRAASAASKAADYLLAFQADEDEPEARSVFTIPASAPESQRAAGVP